MVSIRKQVIAMAKNVRGAGRKKALTEEQLQKARELHGQGTSITDLAVQFGVSRQTMSGYLTVQVEQLDEDCQRVRLFSYWKKLNEMFDVEEIAKCNLRMDYLYKDTVTTAIFVNFQERKVYIKNYTDQVLLRAFGMIKKPTWEDFMGFLEERCLPRGRDDLRATLEKMKLDHYDPLSICEKTGGRILGDDMHLKFYYYGGEAR